MPIQSVGYNIGRRLSSSVNSSPEYPLGNESTSYGSSPGGNTGYNIGVGIGQRLDSLIGYDNEFNANEAAKQRNWETQMSNTAYQRTVADMRKAGLNPYMLYGRGGSASASTPSGATAHAGGSSPLPAAIGALASMHSASLKATASANALERQRLYNSAFFAQQEVQEYLNAQKEISKYL